jgi:hypothetical protein
MTAFDILRWIPDYATDVREAVAGIVERHLRETRCSRKEAQRLAADIANELTAAKDRAREK